ncbi:DEAD/DEAH box helicase [Chloroflexota bacterium]
METSEILDYLQKAAEYQGQMVHIEHLEDKPARLGQLDHTLPLPLIACLKEKGTWPLYSHQAEAVNHARLGRNVMVSTSSASGKTLCYNLPVMSALFTDPAARAIYLFPTKALAQDQLRNLHSTFCPDILLVREIDTFDGDTPYAERNDLRKRTRLIITNPDMLHVGILPNHQSWVSFFRRLRFVVVDEAHFYRGVFGSHVAGILRRLRRVCNQYGAQPQLILSSATVANPAEHAEMLAGLAFSLVAEDGSPKGRKKFVFWNPPLTDEKKAKRRSASSEAAYLFTALVAAGIRTLTFVRSRRLVELVYINARQKLSEIDEKLAELIRPYRAGYLTKDRRKTEKALFGGELLGVVATNALELGIDSGDLEATVLAGYPGTISSTWQQAGRSGRGGRGSTSFLVGADNPLDQYLMNNPDAFFQKNYENVLINLGNPYILRAHLLCAAWEKPLVTADADIFKVDINTEIEALEAESLLKKRGNRWFLSPALSNPAYRVGIRSATGREYQIINEADNSLLETVEADTAFFQVHRGAVFLHQGESYVISKLDLESRMAYAGAKKTDYYTQTRDITDLKIINRRRVKRTGTVDVYMGDVEVTTTVLGFKKKARYTEEVVGEEGLELPPQTFFTVALWFDLPKEAVSAIDAAGQDYAGALHATEHAAIGVLPLFAMCDRNDIGGVSTPLHADTGRAEIFIYDAHPGGIGIAEKGFDMITELWQATKRVIDECPCAEGCPSCIQSPKCGNNNQPLDKAGALTLVTGLLRFDDEHGRTP